MKFENTRVFNFEGAIRGMRNPKESWDKSDSGDVVMNLEDVSFGYPPNIEYVLGENDLKLAQRLIRAGSEHRKFMRQIIVSVDITAPLYWWKEFDTYKVGTVANSTSTMHTIQNKPITKELFEISDYHPELDMIDDINLGTRVDCFINDLEQLRQLFLMTKDEEVKKWYWKELIRWLPEGWLQTRTVTMTYENLFAMCSPGQRRFHKQTEWSKDFILWARSLPYAQQLIFLDELDAQKEKERPAADKIAGLIRSAIFTAQQETVNIDTFMEIISGEINRAVEKAR